jgi:stress response protein YsnF
MAAPHWRRLRRKGGRNDGDREEAVVSKTARVKEEVLISKDATERTETVRDTVRREDVEITKDAGIERTAGSTAASTTAPYPKV